MLVTLLCCRLSGQSSVGQTISDFSPAAASPGSPVSVHGAGLLPDSQSRSSPRELAVFILGNGIEMPARVVNMSTEAVDVLVPAAPTDANGGLYFGSATLCLVIDSRRTCAEKPIQIVPNSQITVPIGATLLARTQAVVDEALSNIPDTIDPTFRESLTTIERSKIADLRKLIEDARAGKPQTHFVKDLKGNKIPVTMDLALIRRVESTVFASPSRLRKK